MGQPGHIRIRFLERLDRMFALTDLFGIAVGYAVGKGVITPVVYSLYFIIPFFIVVIILATITGILRGARTLLLMAGYTFYAVAWLMGLLATFFVGVGIDVLYLSQNLGGAILFVILLILYLYSAWLKYRLRGPLGLNPTQPTTNMTQADPSSVLVGNLRLRQGHSHIAYGIISMVTLTVPFPASALG